MTPDTECRNCMRRLQKHRNMLTYQQYATLRGQAHNGDAEGALRGLDKILHRVEQTGRQDYAEQAKATM